MSSLIYAYINGWVNKHEAGDLRRQWVHYDVIVMIWDNFQQKRYYLQQPFFTADVNEIMKSIKHLHAILLPEVVIIAHLRYAGI